MPKSAHRTQTHRHTGTRALIVTIDGPAGAGKSTVAKLLAKALGVAYLDTGATYRALAFAVLQEHPEVLADEARLALMARYLPLRLEAGRASSLRVFLNGVEITRAIRSQEVSEAAAQVSQYPAVRAAMVVHQRARAVAAGHDQDIRGRCAGERVVRLHAQAIAGANERGQRRDGRGERGAHDGTTSGDG